MDGSFRLGSDGIYRCQAFQQFVWKSHGFGTRHASPSTQVTLRQIHSDIVCNARGLADRQHEGDALISDERGLNIGVRTADCVPILLLDACNRAVAAVHAGWRGSAAGIVSRAIQQMFAAFGSDPANIHAAIGPCIRKCCYEVGPEVAARFGQEGTVHLNLAAANIRQMHDSGVPVTQIHDSCLCTSCQIETFHSYRREPRDPGRLVSAIARIA